MVDKSKSGTFYVSVKMTSLLFLRNWPFLFKRILIIEKFQCHHIALITLLRTHKYRDMIEQTASVLTLKKVG